MCRGFWLYLDIFPEYLYLYFGWNCNFLLNTKKEQWWLLFKFFFLVLLCLVSIYIKPITFRKHDRNQIIFRRSNLHPNSLTSCFLVAIFSVPNYNRGLIFVCAHSSQIWASILKKNCPSVCRSCYRNVKI